MFSFFRRKVTKQVQDDAAKKNESVSKNDELETKNTEALRQPSQVRDRNSSKTKEQSDGRNETDSRQGSKTTCEFNDSIESKSQISSNGRLNQSENCASSESSAESVLNNSSDVKAGIEDQDQDMRRNSKTSKEIVNLLLPEDSVKYKKDSSYLSKVGVQNLLDKIARGKKQIKNEKKKNRSWSFGSHKLKNDIDADRRRSIDCENDFKYTSNSNVFINISEDDRVDDEQSALNFDSLISEIDSINNKFNEDMTKDDITEKSYPMDARLPSVSLIDNDLRTDVGVIIVPMCTRGNTSSGDSGSDLTSKCGKNANGETEEGVSRYFGAEDHQSEPKRDTVPQDTQTVPHEINENQAPLETFDETDDYLSLHSSDSESESESELSDESPPIKQVIDDERIIGASGVANETQNTINVELLSCPPIENKSEICDESENESDDEIDSEYSASEVSEDSEDSDKQPILESDFNAIEGDLLEDQDSDNSNQMGASDSKNNGKKTTQYEEQARYASNYAKSDSAFNNESNEKKDNMQDFVVVIDNNPPSISDINSKSIGSDNDSSVIKGSLSLEIMNLEMKTLPPEEKNVTQIEEHVEYIVEEALTEKDCEEAICESLPEKSNKKHVTFHNVIEFDDGEKVEEDVCEEESYTSFDDLDDDKVFLIDTDNNENPDSEFCDQTAIVELEDSSVSEEEIVDKHKRVDSVVIKELDVENDENVGYEDEAMTIVKEIERKRDALIKMVNEKLGNRIQKTIEEIPVPVEIKIEDSKVEDETDEDVEDEMEEEEVEEEEEEEYSSDTVPDSEDSDKIEPVTDKFTKECESCKWDIDEEVVVNNKNAKLIDAWRNFSRDDKEDESAYSELLKLLERQMRGLVGQEERLADLQERAAALHRVQNEVSSARKEAELVRQKLWHVESDLTATRCRNSQLLEQLEARTEDTKTLEQKIQELTERAEKLQELLDKLVPENEQLKEKYKQLKAERDEERKIIEETLSQEEEKRNAREKWWHTEFEKLRSQGAEREELLLADCEWKLREVQLAAREKTTLAGQKLRDLQKQADERCAKADSQLAEIAEVQTLQAELTTLRQASREQARALRMATERATHAAQAESESGRLRTLLDREKTALNNAKAQFAKELEDKENRLIERLQEQAVRLEKEFKEQQAAEEHERRAKECQTHESMIKDAYDRLEIIKANLAKKEVQYQETLERTKMRADWEILELRRLFDKNETKHAEAIEQLEEKHIEDIENANADMEKKTKELETTLSTQAVSARATLELVRGQLKIEHAEILLRLKEKHKADMEKQWDIFVADKEECLERMKAECILEGQEDKEKREKELVKEVEELKSQVVTQEKELNMLRTEARKATDVKISAEKKLSEMQVACEQREMGVRADLTRQAEVAQRESRETIDHLNKKCACLTNLFEDMRSRWQQAPGEAAQLRKALQDEKSKTAALRRQLDALSRPYQHQKKWKV